jgi:2'-5' RNA ligase
VTDAPLILTLALHADDQARFERLRRLHFPAGRNLIPAHVTLFHHLPGQEIEAVSDAVEARCAATPFPVAVSGLRFLGRGVAYALESSALTALRAGLAREWDGWLTPQDRQGWRPHVTIQNKVPPEAARALHANLQAAFAPFAVRAEGLDLWRYLGGPWEQMSRHLFCG